MSAYETAHLDEIVAEKWPYWAPIRYHFDIRAFGASAWRGGPGDEVIKRHAEEEGGHEELYLVLSGHATFTVGGDEVDAPTGTFIFVREPTTERVAFATEAEHGRALARRLGRQGVRAVRVGGAIVRVVTSMLGELALVGGGGEPVDLRRTLASHGVASLPPQVLDEEAWTLEATLPVGGGKARTVRVRAGAPGHAAVELLGGRAAAGERRDAARDGAAHAPPRRRPHALLRGRRRGRGARLGHGRAPAGCCAARPSSRTS